MIGCYDFCGHYDWTFAWLHQKGGDALLWEYWEQAIARDSQSHAARLIKEKGFAGMEEYWGHTLEDEAPEGGYKAWREGESFNIEMVRCPSRGFLLDNKLEFSGDYCDHCIGWIGPVMAASGFTIKHAHNHQGQCYWHYQRSQSGGQETPEPSRELEKKWKDSGLKVDKFNTESD